MRSELASECRTGYGALQPRFDGDAEQAVRVVRDLAAERDHVAGRRHPNAIECPARGAVVLKVVAYDQYGAGSDFGRTNFYNSQDGKDHWPIGSYVIMEKGQRWTNRVVGETDGLHFAQRINPMTLARDDTNGTIIYPKHVHKALRRYLGIEDSLGAQRFPYNNTEDFGFFG